MPTAPAYAELQVTSNFSFLRGASHAEELVATAAALGLAAIAVTDRNTLAGVVRMYGAAKTAGLKFIVGARIDLTDAPGVLVYPMDRAGYGRLARLLTLGKRRAGKGQCLLSRDDLFAHGDGMIAVALSDSASDLRALKDRFADRVYLAAQHRHHGDDHQNDPQRAATCTGFLHRTPIDIRPRAVRPGLFRA